MLLGGLFLFIPAVAFVARQLLKMRFKKELFLRLYFRVLSIAYLVFFSELAALYFAYRFYHTRIPSLLYYSFAAALVCAAASLYGWFLAFRNIGPEALRKQ